MKAENRHFDKVHKNKEHPELIADRHGA